MMICGGLKALSLAVVSTILLAYFCAEALVYAPYISNTPALLTSGITTLDSISIVGGVFGGVSMVDEGVSAIRVCDSTQEGDDPTNTFRYFILATTDSSHTSVDNSIFVKVIVNLVDTDVYVSASTVTKYKSGVSGVASCSAVNSAFASGSSANLATDWFMNGYGIYNLEYTDGILVYQPWLNKDPAIVAEGVDSLYRLNVYGAMYGGQETSIPEGQECQFFCELTSEVQNSTTRSFLCAWEYTSSLVEGKLYGMVKASFRLSETGEMTVQTPEHASGASQHSGASVVDCVSAVNTYTSTQLFGMWLATSASEQGYGIFDISYDLTHPAPSVAPTAVPSHPSPTTGPTPWHPSIYEAYIGQSATTLATGVLTADFVQSFAVYGADFGGQGSAVPEGQSCDFVCLIAETDSTRMYALGVKDPTYYKFVVVNFQLISGTISMNVVYGHYVAESSFTLTTCDDVITTMNYGTNYYHIALSSSDAGYGVFNLAYSVSAPPPSAAPTAASGGSSSGVSLGIVIGAAVGGSVLLVLVLVMYFYCSGRRESNSSGSVAVIPTSPAAPTAPVGDGKWYPNMDTTSTTTSAYVELGTSPTAAVPAIPTFPHEEAGIMIVANGDVEGQF